MLSASGSRCSSASAGGAGGVRGNSTILHPVSAQHHQQQRGCAVSACPAALVHQLHQLHQLHHQQASMHSSIRGVAVLARARPQQHGSMHSFDGTEDQQQQQPADQQLYHQHLQHIPSPDWHPRLFGLKDTKRAALEAAARLYYTEVWNRSSTDLLDEIADAGVCFNDALGMEADAFSRASLKSIIAEFQSSHPLLKYDLEDVLVDEDRDTVVAHYTVTAAHLLPQPDGTAATGHVSVVSGMDKIHFTGSGMISSILSFRQRFTEEEAEPINWDS